MNPRQQASAEYVKQLIEAGPLPRNQVATISGLTNTYIRDLERGAIVNAERGKIIALGLALNQTLAQLDEMLRLFDRAPLSLDDIPLFLAIAGKSKSSSVLLPVRNPFSFDLYTIAAIKTPGKHALASYKPTAALQPQGYWLHEHRQRLDEHAIYGELVEALGCEMGHKLETLLKSWPVEQYVSRHAMEEYLSANQDPERRKWHVAHVKRLIEYLDRYENLGFNLTHQSSSFLFTLKTATKSSKFKDHLLISYPLQPGPKLRNVGLLAGFSTGNSVMIASFHEELGILRSLVDEKLQDRQKTIDYLEKLITRSQAGF
ncbi:MAG: hypothetical protein D3926_21825 [Desulfobacteraceae bacterium]|nr:MAG: hypothetical protein D3926_21825 [Desulfobacteraceae bacterium]